MKERLVNQTPEDLSGERALHARHTRDLRLQQVGA